MFSSVVFRKLVCVLVSMSLIDAPVSAASPKAYDRATDDDSRLALVIGNSAYLADPLDNPVNDANAVAKALDRLGFEVMLAKDLNTVELRRRVRVFLERAEHERGTALVYYAGHAVAPGGRNILLPVDINPRNVREVEDEGVHVAKMLNSLETSRKHTRILIFDACRDNPYGQAGEKLIRTLHRVRGAVAADTASDKQRLTALAGGMAEVSAKGTLVAFSTAPGSVAEDGEGRTNSLFTAHLVDALSIPGLTITEVFRRVTERVKSETRGAQVPWIAGALERPFVFHPAAPAALAVGPASEQPGQLIGEQRRAGVEAQLAAEMAKIKKLQRAEKERIEQVALAKAEQERVANERVAAEKTLADLAEARRIAEVAEAVKKAEAERVALQEATDRKAREDEGRRIAAERAEYERLAALRAAQLERERKAEEAARAREVALAESRRLAEIEQARVAEVRRLEDIRKQRETEERERLARDAEARERERVTAEAEARRLKALALEKVRADERERAASLALQKEREMQAAERARAEAARLALLAEIAKPVAMVDAGAAESWLRVDSQGDLFVRGVKLPGSVRITSPSADLPPSCRVFNGAWGRARWEGERSAEVWIEAVDANCGVRGIYARGGDSVDGDQPSYVRIEGRIQSAKLKVRVSATAVLSLSPSDDGGLDATWESSSKRISTTFQRISNDPKANTEYVALEDQDNGGRPTSSISPTNFSRALPMEVPGVRTLSTAQLNRMLAEKKTSVLVSAHEGQIRPLIERSTWLPDLGKPMSYRAVNGGVVRLGAKELEDLRVAMTGLTDGDKSRPIIVYDRSVAWGWFGYHGALRLREMGYTNVFWYRGGADAWHDAGLPLTRIGS